MLKKDDFLEGLLFKINLLNSYLVYSIYILILEFSEEFQISWYKFTFAGIISGFSASSSLRQKAPIFAAWRCKILTYGVEIYESLMAPHSEIVEVRFELTTPAHLGTAVR
jgi:hypothetical protein